MMDMPRPLVATIDSSALRHNLARARNAAPQAKVWAIVKANAYGHGLTSAVRGFAAADGFGLIEIDRAVRLRELGWTKPIMLLEGFFAPEDIPILLEHDLQTTVHCKEQIDMLERADLDKPLAVHLKMNSGMNRLGFAPDEYAAAHARLRALPGIGKISLMTHFANADNALNPRLTMSEQIRRFEHGIAGLGGEQSVANSATILSHAAHARDWIRPGIMLYGGTPGGGSAAEFGLLPAMTLRSELIAVQTVRVGEAVGYGSQYIVSLPMRVGVVACGYADGYPRHAPNGTPVLVDGVRTTLIGRVSMDMITVDLTLVPQAHVGSKVTLWGEGLPIDEVAEPAGTIGYELMCGLAPRVAVLEI
jgi:alanine racemase